MNKNPALERVDALLAPYDIEVIEHPAVLTVEEADKFTPDPSAGLKTIVLQAKTGKFVICVLLGNQRLSSKDVKAIVNSKVNFAPIETVIKSIGCEQGATPPIKYPADASLIIDKSVIEKDIVYFNPGVGTLTYGAKVEYMKKIWETQEAIFAVIAQSN